MKIAIIGQGGHSKVIQDLILADKKNRVVAYFDDKYEGLTINKHTFFGPISSSRKIFNYFEEVKFVIAVGNNKVRKLIADQLALSADFYLTLVHPTAIISPSVQIGSGTVILAHTIINADSQIGQHSIINSSAVIEHDNKIGDFVHVSPNATLTGDVAIEEGVHIGAAAVVIPGVKIGEWSVIGAGATVINDIPSHCTAVGIPARVKIKKDIEGG